ncbi:MAG: hypothetical protein ABSG68_21020 [Thermoguttaceae bacterium]|jgi:hypothetical protein
MFRLYDQTRRRLCLGAFLLLCMLPTVLVAGWCVAWHLPGHKEAEAQRLAGFVGLEVSLSGLTHPLPGTMVYEGLELSDPETGRCLLHCRSLEATWSTMTDREGRRRPAVVLLASQPEVEADALERLGQLLQRVLQGQAVRPEAEVRLRSSELSLHSGQQWQTLTQVAGEITVLPEGVQAQAEFHLPGAEGAEPTRIRILRNRQLRPPANGIQLDTGGGQLPAQLLAAGWPEFRQLGATSRFRGTLLLTQGSGGWDGEACGQLSGVDLGGLVSENFPHRLSGTANIILQRAILRRGRLEAAVGSLAAGPGVIGRSLVEAAARQLHLARGLQPPEPRELLPYTQLALMFWINSEGLTLKGACGDPSARMILVNDQQPLLGDAPAQPQPIAALIRTLVLDSAIQLPATRQTDWLARSLPMPEASAPHAAGSPPQRW